MFDESLITILFRLLNFAALIGLFVYLYKRYFQHTIEQDIERERLEKINIKEHIEQLDLRAQELAHAIIEQENLCKKLVERTERWKEASENTSEQHRQDELILLEKTVQRAHRQKEMIGQQRLIQAVFPTALQKAREELVASFKQPTQSKQFVSNILVYMKKSE